MRSTVFLIDLISRGKDVHQKGCHGSCRMIFIFGFSMNLFKDLLYELSFGFAYNFVIFVPSERFPSLPGSNAGSFERLPSASNALKFGFS